MRRDNGWKGGGRGVGDYKTSVVFRFEGLVKICLGFNSLYPVVLLIEQHKSGINVRCALGSSLL